MTEEEFAFNYPNYKVTRDGVVYKNGIIMKPFKSNKYLQVLLYDKDHNRHIFGVHTLVAMLYLPKFYVGCIVHHIDSDTHNNNAENLEIMSQSEHARKHGKEYCACVEHTKKYGPWNKNKKMSPEFCKKCSESAKRRYNKQKSIKIEGSYNSST